jgi:hypothetical protein
MNPHKRRLVAKTMFVAGPYKPEYKRDCELVLERHNDDNKSKIKNGYKTA